MIEKNVCLPQDCVTFSWYPLTTVVGVGRFDEQQFRRRTDAFSAHSPVVSTSSRAAAHARPRHLLPETGGDHSGRVQQESQPPKAPNVAKSGTVWPTGHWWLGRASELGCDGPKIALPKLL